MKKLLLVFIISFCASCETPYKGETIINLNLKIVDSNSQPIANETVNIGSGSYSEDFNDYSTYNKTSDINGVLNFKMFAPTNSATLYIDNSSNYLPLSIIGLSEDNFSNYNWDLGTIMLFKQDEIIPFNITLNQTTATKSITKIEVIADQYQNSINLNSFQDADYELQTNYFLKKNQNFILKYELKNSITNLTETIEENLSISDTEYNFILTF